MTTKKKTHKSPACTDAELAKLAHGAAVARDHELYKLVARAMQGSKPARKECARIIHASKHMHGSG